MRGFHPRSSAFIGGSTPALQLIEPVQIRPSARLNDIRGRATPHHLDPALLGLHRCLAHSLRPAGDRTNLVANQPRRSARGRRNSLINRIHRTIPMHAASRICPSTDSLTVAVGMAEVPL